MRVFPILVPLALLSLSGCIEKDLDATEGEVDEAASDDKDDWDKDDWDKDEEDYDCDELEEIAEELWERLGRLHFQHFSTFHRCSACCYPILSLMHSLLLCQTYGVLCV